MIAANAEPGTWGIYCTVSGGVTGRRQAWLKSDGEVVEFGTREEAEAEATRLRSSMGRNSATRFTYTAMSRVGVQS